MTVATVSALSAQESTQTASFAQLAPLVELAEGAQRRDLLEHAFAVRARSDRGLKVDLTPALDAILGFLHEHGIPLREDHALGGKHGIVFSAAWSVGEDTKPVRFHIGDRGPLDAFYGDKRGFRVALVWPIAQDLALHVEGGENSEFGNWGICGLQWRHPTRPLAVGVGVPLALDGARGEVGLLFQLRMLLE